MPLIIVTGRPCTGKTTFSNQLRDHLLSSGKEHVVLVNEESLNLNKVDSYQSATKEKVLRGAIKSAADHALTTSTYVIVDSLNYIKGYRYELYCTSRTVRTPHCVVWVAASEDTAATWNKERMDRGDDRYEESVFADLLLRYEAPNESNRWDAPLFRVNSQPSGAAKSNRKSAEAATIASVISDSISTVVKAKSSWKPKKASQPPLVQVPIEAPADSAADGAAPLGHSPKGLWFSGSMAGVTDDLSAFQTAEEVLHAMTAYFSTAQAPTPNSSTVIAQHAQADLLYELDRTSQQITQVLVAHQAENVEGTPVRLVDYDRILTVTRFTSMVELQRLRRQWVKINAQHPPNSTQAIGASFIDFLAVHL
ncbi:hypothetical protein EON65_22915 [archaeon]|nr:MAG: hypothetical protein EON65_22915 [archaeon]